ncbi:MAG: hypothetical protein ACRC5M_03890 [Anaeroplasmataceae bacterium]
MSIISNLNCIMILDESVRESLKSNISNLVIYGIDIIDDIRNINEKQVAKTRKVIILGGFRHDSINDLKLYKDLLNLDYYFISNDKLMIGLLESFCKCYLLDYTNVSSNMIYSVLYDDDGEKVKYIPLNDTLQSVEHIKTLSETSHDKSIVKVSKEYLLLRELLDGKLRDEELYKDKIKSLESQIVHHIAEIENVSKNYTNLVESVMKQSKVLKDYEVYFAQDLYKKLQTAGYKERPKIIYLKEYQDLIHEKSFLVTLFNSIRLQKGMSCKLLRLHDSSDLIRIKSLEDDYKLINSQFIESDVISSDFILSYGNYEKLLDLLLVNKYKLDVLIVLDCKKYEDVVLSGTDMIYFNLCRNVDTMKILGLNPLNTINNNSESILSWDTYEEYSSIKDDGVKLEFLASRHVIRKIYGLLEDN